MGLIDVPPGRTRKFMPTTFLGRPAWFPHGLLQIAERNHLPVAFYVVRLHEPTGQRILNVHRLNPGTVADQFSQVIELLERQILADSPTWHHWPGVASFFVDPALLPPE